MFLSGALFVLFLAGCWVYCLTDAAVTPAAEFPGSRKRLWLAVIALTFIFGSIAWFIVRRSRSRRARQWPLAETDYRGLADYGNVGWYPDRPPTPAEAALARHPASRARKSVPIGPDDDPEFLRQLAQRIRGEQ